MNELSGVDEGVVQFPGQVGHNNEEMMSSDVISSRNNNTTSLVSIRHTASAAAADTKRNHHNVKATTNGSEHCYGNTREHTDDDIDEEIIYFSEFQCKACFCL